MQRLALAPLALLLAACSSDPASSTSVTTGGPSTEDPTAASDPTGGPTTGTSPTTGTPGTTTDSPATTSTPDPTSTTSTTDPTSTTSTSSTTGEPVEPDPPRCLDIPTCASVEKTAVEMHLSLLDGCAFALAPTDIAAGLARADTLLAKAGTAVPIETVLGQLNREAIPGLSAYQAERMKNHDVTGFRWNAGDGDVTYWYPQGITGSSDARDDGKVAGRRLLLVSWYHKIDREPTDPPARGVRLSLVDLTDLDAIRYRHLLLVTPTDDGMSFTAANTGSGDALHAGGIAWVGDKLHVAETSRGLRVYDMSRIFATTHTDDADAIGIGGGQIHAHGYAYVVPEIARYQLTDDSCKFRFSAVALDRGADPPVLVTAEYQTDLTGRVARWPIDLATGALTTESGVAYALDAALSGQTRVQGAVTHDGVYYLSSSSQTSQWGRLYRNRPDQDSEITAWPDGPEDLYIEADLNLIWTAAEHPTKRVTLGIPMQGY